MKAVAYEMATDENLLDQIISNSEHLGFISALENLVELN